MLLAGTTLQILPVCGTPAKGINPSRDQWTIIPPKTSMDYFGAVVHGDGAVRRELGGRLGFAWSECQKLGQLWGHTSLPTSRKLQVLHAAIISRLLYALEGAWLNVAERRRLDGFFCRCLRVVFGIRPTFVSRISNATVLQRAGQGKLSQILLKRQLLLYGKVVRALPDDPGRNLTFIPGTRTAATNRHQPLHREAGQVKRQMGSNAGARGCENVYTFCNHCP